jgi:hypothetical protein
MITDTISSFALQTSDQLPVKVSGVNVAIPSVVMSGAVLDTAVGGLRIVNLSIITPVPACVSLSTYDGGRVPFQVIFDNHGVVYTVEVPALNVMVSCDIPLYSYYSGSGVTGVVVSMKGNGQMLSTITDTQLPAYVHLTVEKQG